MLGVNKNVSKVVASMLVVSSVSSFTIFAAAEEIGEKTSGAGEFLYSTRVANSIVDVNDSSAYSIIDTNILLVSGTAVTTDYLNVRTGPSVVYDREEVFPKGTKINIIGHFADTNWFKVIRIDGSYGYVCGDYLTNITLESQPIKPLQTVTSHTGENPSKTEKFGFRAVVTANLNLRIGPSKSFAVQTVIPKGATVELAANAVQNNWYKVSYGNLVGFVFGDYIKSQGNDLQSTTVKSTSSEIYSNTSNITDDGVIEFNAIGTVTAPLNVRSAPGISYSKSGLLYKGDKVNIVGRFRSGWYKIKYGNSYGYVSSEYVNNISETTTSSTSAKEQTTLIPVIKTTGSTSEATIKTVPTIVESENVDSGIKLHSGKGTVTTALNIRSGPETTYSKIGLLYSGNRVEVVGILPNGWLKISYSKGYGYVSGSYILLDGVEKAPADPTDDLLYLPNKDPLSKNYVPQGLVSLKKTYGLASSGDQMLVSEVAGAYYDMYKAAKSAGVLSKGDMVANSAYRSYATQKSLYDSMSNKKQVQKPGMSEHQYGVSIDIAQANYSTFASSPLCSWLKNNSYKYGFILRYTADKTNITGIISEPWHYRYVGKEHAKSICNSGLCLEEYVELF